MTVRTMNIDDELLTHQCMH